MAPQAVREFVAMIRRTASWIGPMLLGLAMTLPALAGSGRGEIRQACAVDTGCFEGDGPGFPVTIDASAGHSYVLTGDLVVSDPSLDAISINADAVVIDLNGFTIAGPVICIGVGSDVSCGAGTGNGIDASNLVGTAVVNGRVRGFGNRGLSLGDASRVENVIAESNGQHGIFGGSGSLARASTGIRNGADGIAVLSSIVSGCTADGNGDDGISVGSGSVTVRNSSTGNGARGIRFFNGGVVRENSASHNESDGFGAGGRILISDNASFENGGDGIVGAQHSCVQRNSISSNGEFGVRSVLAFDVPELWKNAIHDNAAGTCSTCVDVSGNVCDGALGCP